MIDREVGVFFAGGPASCYQLEQWRRPLEELNRMHPLVVIVTNYDVYDRLLHDMDFATIYVKDFGRLVQFYAETELAVVLYVNNALRNFWSLRYSRGFHVHLNHGESEKESMRSNQSRGYDRVFTVGQRGIDRYREYLLNFEADKYVAIGRPQLDFIEPLSLPRAAGSRVVLYAPTWEATHPSMDYCSVGDCGVDLVHALLEDRANIVAYKPHPAVGSRDPEVGRAHTAILEILGASDRGYVLSEEPINDVFAGVDFAFFDNSSVMVDYLNTDRPGAYIEVQSDQTVDLLAEAYEVVAAAEVAEWAKGLEQYLEHDPVGERRRLVRSHYLGDHGPGEATALFVKAVDELVGARRQLAPGLRR